MWLWAGAVPGSYLTYLTFTHPRCCILPWAGWLHIALHRYSASKHTTRPRSAVLLFLWCNTRPASFEKVRGTVGVL
jgi:hypothetical protein